MNENLMNSIIKDTRDLYECGSAIYVKRLCILFNKILIDFVEI